MCVYKNRYVCASKLTKQLLVPLLVPSSHSQDVERLRQELERYREEQEQLRQTKARVLVMEERLRDLHWEDEANIAEAVYYPI